AGMSRFKHRVLAERCRHIDHRSLSACLCYCLVDGIEHRQAKVGLSTLARRHAADHLGAVGNRLFGVIGALGSGEALADNACVLVQQYTHASSPAALTTCCAASTRLVAAMMLRPLSASSLPPSS